MASSEMTTKTVPAPARAQGAVDGTPKSTDLRDLPMSTATGNPAPTPANGTQTKRASAQAGTILRSAPIAMHTPMPRLSSRTVQDAREKMPIPAKISDIAAMVPDTVVKARSFASACSARMCSVVIPIGNSTARTSIRSATGAMMPLAGPSALTTSVKYPSVHTRPRYVQET